MTGPARDDGSHRDYLGEVVLGTYLLDRLIGAGASSWVFHGRTRAGDDVAVKVLRSAEPAAATRFAREVRVLKALPARPGLVGYLADGRTRDGRPLVVIEHVPGVTLREAMERRGPVPEREALACVIELCDAVADMHALGLAHRDIKPGNVLLTPQGRTKLIDLGLVMDSQGLLGLLEREAEPGGPRVFAEELDRGVLAGTLRYMAPEQLADATLADASRAVTGPWSDVFALGVVLYELVAGEPPFRVEGELRDAGALLAASGRIGLAPGEPRPWPGAISAGLRGVLETALRRAPTARHVDCRALRDDLVALLETGRGASRRDDEETARAAIPAALLAQEEPTRPLEPARLGAAGLAREREEATLPFEAERTAPQAVRALSGGRLDR